MLKNASLTVVGTGIKFVSHLTVETKTYIEKSDKVLYLVNDPGMKQWIQNTNVESESLDFLYSRYNLRKDNYKIITDYVLENLRKNQHICFALYGHPCVFAQSGIDSVKIALKEGFHAKILPGISAQDCLFSDLLIDPGSQGCQSFDATDFLLYKRKVDPRSHLLLWQIDIIGALNNPETYNNNKGAQAIIKYLNNFYDLNHEVILYEAAQYPGFQPKIQKFKLKSLSDADFSRICTLYLPPIENYSYDEKALLALKIKIDDLTLNK